MNKENVKEILLDIINDITPQKITKAIDCNDLESWCELHKIAAKIGVDLLEKRCKEEQDQEKKPETNPEPKPTFNIADYPSEVVMHCKTEQEAESFCRYLDSVGEKWSSGKRYKSENNYQIYGPKTCYDFNWGEYCEKDYYEGRGYKILEFSDFEWPEPLYNGKVVCIDNQGAVRYTVGKIYQFKCGRIIADSGGIYSQFKSFEEWEGYSSAKWLEIKE